MLGTPRGGAAPVAANQDRGLLPARVPFSRCPVGIVSMPRTSLPLGRPNFPGTSGEAGSIGPAFLARPVLRCALRAVGGPGSPRFPACPPHRAGRPAGPASAPLRKHAGDGPQSHSALTFDKPSLAFPCSNMLSLSI